MISPTLLAFTNGSASLVSKPVAPRDDLAGDILIVVEAMRQD